MHCAQIQQGIAPLREALLMHPMYQRIGGLDELRLFMESHVFAVWDFMSLLKALQSRLTCTSTPWVPAESGFGARLVNEVVLAEESDEDGQGGYASHFELYRAAMVEAGADTRPIDRFVRLIAEGAAPHAALLGAGAPRAATQFVAHTFDTIRSDSLPAMASAFTFGREDLLPDLFCKIVERIDRESAGALGTFRYDLERHIELDGDEHGPLALKLIEQICGEDAAAWRDAEFAAVRALESRHELWEGVAIQFATSSQSAAG